MKKSHLTLRKRLQFPSQKEPGPPPPIEIEGEMEYAVKEIRGYPDEGDTWEPVENLEDAHNAIEEFLGNDTPTLHAQQITISCHITDCISMLRARHPERFAKLYHEMSNDYVPIPSLHRCINPVIT